MRIWKRFSILKDIAKSDGKTWYLLIWVITFQYI